ncbi:MAG: D-alanyl-D-alanine carboxypeptidase [Verrucomicrobiales bacterium]|nr:D-alanyl-D-alanine carboxypeptidase [Verrucomicrobiales bacterium]
MPPHPRRPLHRILDGGRILAIGLLLAFGSSLGFGATTETPTKKKTNTSTKSSSEKSTKSTPAKTAPGKSKAAPAKSSAISRNPYLGAIAVDAATGRVLAEDQADVSGYPASMLKLMDLLLVLESIQRGELRLDDTATVSAKSAKTGGSQVWLAEKEVFTVEDLLFALMIQSANDAAVALAERTAGSTEAFVERMNKKAQALGMTQTTFQSVHGLPPGAGQQPDRTTARDFSLLCRELVLRHPEALRYTSTREREFRPAVPDRKVIMRTHNHLLSQVQGCDGLKTGYFFNAGFSVAATASRNGQRVIAIVLGSVDRKVRDAKAADFLARGFQALAPPAPPAASSTPPPSRSR